MDAKKQHTVPQFYLRDFAFRNRAWAVRKGSHGWFDNPFEANVRDLCSMRNYHEVKVSHAGSPGDLSIRNRVEKQLSKQEHDLTGPLRDVTSAQKLATLKVVTAQNLDSMKNLLAHMMVRNPINLDSAREESEEFSKSLVAKGLLSQGDLSFLDAIGLTPSELTEHSIIRAELWSLEEGTPMRSVLSWLDDAGVLLLRARVGSQFVTADVPFELGWADAKSELPSHIFFPLDWRTAVIFHTYDRELSSRYAEADEVSWWNWVLAKWCEDTSMVVAKSEQALRLVMGESGGSS